MSKTWTEATGVLEPQALDRNYLFDHASGTGPFKLVSATLDGTVVLARNPDWWGLEDSLTTSTGSSILGSATIVRVPRPCCGVSRI
jgi:ABC-type transport system substrate-binding protein